MKIKNLKIILVLVLGFTLAACTGTQGQDTTPFKDGGGGSPVSPDNPAEKMKQAALKDKVLLSFENTSKLLAVSGDRFSVRADFKINQIVNLGWTHIVILDLGESAEYTYKEIVGNPEENLKLSVKALRFEKNNIEFLALAYKLARPLETTEKSSQFLVLINLKLSQNPKAFVAKEFNYPIKPDFDLKKWADSKIK